MLNYERCYCDADVHNTERAYLLDLIYGFALPVDAGMSNREILRAIDAWHMSKLPATDQWEISQLRTRLN